MFIALGVTLIHRFEWVIYVFGAVLIYSGIQMAAGEREENPSREESGAEVVPQADAGHGELRRRKFLRETRRAPLRHTACWSCWWWWKPRT